MIMDSIEWIEHVLSVVNYSQLFSYDLIVYTFWAAVDPAYLSAFRERITIRSAKADEISGCRMCLIDFRRYRRDRRIMVDIKEGRKEERAN